MRKFIQLRETSTVESMTHQSIDVGSPGVGLKVCSKHIGCSYLIKDLSQSIHDITCFCGYCQQLYRVKYSLCLCAVHCPRSVQISKIHKKISDTEEDYTNL